MTLGLIGAVLGIPAAIGYTALMMYGLRTWWVGAVGTMDDGVSDDLYPAEISEVSLGGILDAGFDHRETTRDLRVKVEAEAIEAPARWVVVHVVKLRRQRIT